MNPTSVDIKDLLVTSGLGVFAATSGWSISIGTQDDSLSDTLITLYDTGGWREPNPKLLVDYPKMMVKVRGAPFGYVVAHSKAFAVRKVLLGMPKTTLNTTVYTGVWVLSDVAYIGVDESNRPTFSMNLRIIREPQSTSDDYRE